MGSLMGNRRREGREARPAEEASWKLLYLGWHCILQVVRSHLGRNQWHKENVESKKPSIFLRRVLFLRERE
jgi:hypothetical protein